MATKTINLTGAEVAVTGLDGANAHIRNDGTEVIYAAKTAGITAGADGVASIPAGQSDTIRGISGAVYLLGTGSVLMQSDDYVASPFKTSAASGGSAVDEVARAAINAHSGNEEIHVTAAEKASWNGKAELSDIPTTLPANGGNAETVSGKSLSQIMTSDGFFTGDLDELKVQCSVLAQDCTNAPENAAYWGTVCVYIGGTGSVVQIFAETTLNSNELTKVFIRHFTGHFWSPWKNIADGGNANTLNGLHANEIARNPNLLINPDFAVNQYVTSSTISSVGYFIDRWQLADGEVTINSNGTLTLNGTIKQILEKAAGTDVIASASAGTASYDDATRTFRLTANGEVIKWVKLEIGSIATAFAPPDPATELEKCQRYYQIRSAGNIAEVDLRPSMRATPTITQLSDGNYAYSAEL